MPFPFPPLDSSSPSGFHSMPRPPRKRPFPDQVDGGCHVKVYVAPVPRTATETDIRLVFEGHGTIVEVVLLKDKRTGARQGSCFVKYATLDEADRAIKALSNQFTFPGESSPVVVRFADRELQRLGVRGFCRNLEKKDPLEEVADKLADKVFVSYINREASKKEIEELDGNDAKVAPIKLEIDIDARYKNIGCFVDTCHDVDMWMTASKKIFSPYGHVEDVFIAHNRGYAFVKFSNREMALAAIKGLNETFTMRGCDHPLIVRFADPKKPKTGESRGNYFSGNANFGPCSQEPAVWPLPNFGNPNTGGSIVPIVPHNSTVAHPQVTPHMQNWGPGATLVQQPFPPQQAHSQLASMPLGSIQAPKLSSQPFVTEVQRQSHPAHSSVHIEQQLSSQPSTQAGSNPNTVAGCAPPDMPTSPQNEDPPECDWSEHYCPDGHKYYYNCVTCESRWEKPEEYALYEKESQKQEDKESQKQQELGDKESQKQQEQEDNESQKQQELGDKESQKQQEQEDNESQKQQEQQDKEFQKQREKEDKESQVQQQQEDNSCSDSQLSLPSCQQVSQRQQETNEDHRQLETSPVVA